MEWYYVVAIVIGGVAVWLLLSSVFYRCFFKRFYDVLLSGIAILVFSPLFLILIVSGAIKMKGNPFFTQMRPGKINKKTGKERIFKLIKFRTMTCEKDEQGNLLPDEKRLTRYGKKLRSTSLDEIPELFNIFIGDMSIVGPRPQLVRDMVFMTEEQRVRHCVRPGLSGLAQVNGRNAIAWEDKLRFDVEYVKKITLFKDVLIIFKTVYKVLKRSDIDREGTATDMDFGDYLLQKEAISVDYYNEKQAEAKKLLEECL